LHMAPLRQNRLPLEARTRPLKWLVLNPAISTFGGWF
jgi:hypothetical protein